MSSCLPSVCYTLIVAAASDLALVLPKVNEMFELENKNVSVKPVFSASGILASQILKDAPFGVFLSADTSIPKNLVEKDKALPQLYPYAKGSLVLWIAEKHVSFVEEEIKKNQSNPLLNLKNSSIKKIALANPDHAPFGHLALKTNQKLFLVQTQPKQPFMQSRVLLMQHF
jgi:molybdate transport system substrate-binding protein